MLVYVRGEKHGVADETWEMGMVKVWNQGCWENEGNEEGETEEEDRYSIPCNPCQRQHRGTIKQRAYGAAGKRAVEVAGRGVDCERECCSPA